MHRVTNKVVLATMIGALALLVALGGVASAGSAGSPKKVDGSVGPGFTIKLAVGGKSVTKLKAGDSRFPPDGPGREQGDHERAVHGHEDGRPDVQEGHLQVRLRPARLLDERELHGRLRRRRRGPRRPAPALGDQA
jgi:hypothetical protein